MKNMFRPTPLAAALCALALGPLEKIEGAAVLPSGDVLIVNDNDGVDDSNGETQLINLGPILN